ncbi:MAG: ankyrin repeat domain-containing protein [Brevinema sp.]
MLRTENRLDKRSTSIKKLLELSENTRAEYGGWDTLHEAAGRGDLEQVKRLVDEGGDINRIPYR